MSQIAKELRSQRNVPADATEILPPELAKIDAVFYFFDVGRKRCVSCFQYSALEPVFEYGFNEDSIRQKFVDDYIASAAKYIGAKKRKSR